MTKWPLFRKVAQPAPWLVLAAGLCLAAGAQEDAAKKDLEQMQGTWTVAAQEMGGAKLTDEQIKQANVKLVVKGDKYTLSIGDQPIAHGTIKLDPAKKPKAIDTTAEGEQHKGQKMLGIYTLEKDEMKVLFTQPGEDRPAEFRTKQGTQQILITYKRVKS
jgi:uncharacterized protein (TIGR03067 family)